MKSLLWMFLVTQICYGQQLTRDIAAARISATNFAKPKMVKLEPEVASRCSEIPNRLQPVLGWNAALQAGWIRLQETNDPQTMVGVRFENFICKAVVTQAGQQYLRPGSFGALYYLEAEVARPGNIAVTGVSRQGSEALVEFSYEMVLTQAGKVLVNPFPRRNAQASFRLYDDGWRITGIEKPTPDAYEGNIGMPTDTTFRQVQWNPSWASGKTGNSTGGTQSTPVRSENAGEPKADSGDILLPRVVLPTPPPALVEEAVRKEASVDIHDLYVTMRPAWVESFARTGRCDALAVDHPEATLCASFMSQWEAKKGKYGGWYPPNLELFAADSVHVTLLNVKIKDNVAVVEATASATCAHIQSPYCLRAGSRFSSAFKGRLVLGTDRAAMESSWKAYDFSDVAHDLVPISPNEALAQVAPLRNCTGVGSVKNAKFFKSKDSNWEVNRESAAGAIKMTFECFKRNGEATSTSGTETTYVRESGKWRFAQ